MVDLYTSPNSRLIGAEPACKRCDGRLFCQGHDTRGAEDSDLS
jgi:hypothetical protein